jgi:hypothetical protein
MSGVNIPSPDTADRSSGADEGAALSATILLQSLADRYMDYIVNENETGIGRELDWDFSDREPRGEKILGEGGVLQLGLAGWLQDYGVIQGIQKIRFHGDKELFVGRLVDEVVNLFAHWGDRHTDLSQADMLARYKELNALIGNLYLKTDHAKASKNPAAGRSFKSMTSKLLWLQYPSSVPIYDKNAQSSLNAIWRIYKSLSSDKVYKGLAEQNAQKMPRKLSKAQTDCLVYERFCAQYFKLFGLVQESLSSELRARNSRIPPIRFFDKLLWVLGDGSRDLGHAN